MVNKSISSFDFAEKAMRENETEINAKENEKIEQSIEDKIQENINKYL